MLLLLHYLVFRIINASIIPLRVLYCVVLIVLFCCMFSFISCVFFCCESQPTKVSFCFRCSSCESLRRTPFHLLLPIAFVVVGGGGGDGGNVILSLLLFVVVVVVVVVVLPLIMLISCNCCCRSYWGLLLLGC